MVVGNSQITSFTGFQGENNEEVGFHFRSSHRDLLSHPWHSNGFPCLGS